MTTYYRLPSYLRGVGINCQVCGMRAGSRKGKRTVRGWICKNCLEALALEERMKRLEEGEQLHDTGE